MKVRTLSKMQTPNKVWSVEIVTLSNTAQPKHGWDAPGDGCWYLIRHLGRTKKHVLTPGEVESVIGHEAFISLEAVPDNDRPGGPETASAGLTPGPCHCSGLLPKARHRRSHRTLRGVRADRPGVADYDSLMALGVEVDHRAVHHVNRSPGEGGLQLGDQSVASALVATAGKLVKTWNAEKTGIDQEFAAERIAHWLSYLPKCEWSPELPERGDAGRLPKAAA